MCGKKFNGDFVVFSVGALREVDENYAVMDEDLTGFMCINSHMDSKEQYENVQVFDEVKGGQCEVYTCSTECMRSYFNEIVDDLEEKIHQRGPKIRKIV